MGNDNGRRLSEVACSWVEPTTEGQAVKGFEFDIASRGRGHCV